MASQDLPRPGLPQLDWSAKARGASLTEVFEHASGLARTAEGWYAAKRPAKKAWGRALRVGAILLGAAAAILPIVGQITTTDGTPSIAPGWAAVALTVAATLIALDHYFGFSSSWTRFMASELRVTRLRHDFDYAWNALRANAADPPDDAQVDALIELARTLVLAVDDLILDETGSWVTEFRGTLERAEQALSSRTGR
jgi:hypothetical protein